MTASQFVKIYVVRGKGKDVKYLSLQDKLAFKRKLMLFMMISIPFLCVLTIAFNNIYALEKSILERVYMDKDFLDGWDRGFGKFLRDYYLDKRYDGFRDKSSGDNSWIWGKLPPPPPATEDQCGRIEDGFKFDCLPRGEVSEKACTERGCCYLNTSAPHVPYCYYPSRYGSYKYTNITQSDRGITALLTAQFKSPYLNDIVKLKMDFIFVSDQVIFINISNANEKRYRFPFPEEPLTMGVPSNPLYSVRLDINSTGFEILRKSSNRSIFNTKDIGGFTFSDQFIQISSKLPGKYIYGLGEQRNNFLRDLSWETITLFNHDSLPLDYVNGYGFHPFYLAMEEDGMSHGVLLWNNHPMDIVLQPGPAITYRMIGGYLGFYITLGPSPTEVIQQYTSQVVGLPIMPPYWSLGFHLCRFGYKTLDDMIKVWNQTRAAGIPFDTQWTDLDYMEGRKDFTWDKVNFKGLNDFVNHLHSIGMHYMLILDPGLSASEPAGTYPPYDEGIAQGVFIMDQNGKKPFLGKVWNTGSTAFVDFSNPKVVYYWLQQLIRFHQQIPFDGAWIDMNDPSNFLNGTTGGCPKNKLDYPPYVPGVDGGLLSYKTLCMSAVQSAGKHYDLHNMYGTLEAIVTSFGMAQLRKSRPFVISRSTSAGIGRFAGHWTGDIRSTWDDMKHSIGDIMSFSMFGVPMVGADICGFNGNTTASLCQRWSQLGAFYPFSRNHNTDDAIAQDPVSLGDGVASSAKKALLLRYSLLPYLYTLFWEAATTGAPVVQPLFFRYPNDVNTYGINTQFMWGERLMIAPVLEEGITYVKAYFGSGVWYNLETKERIESKGQYYVVSAPVDTIPLFYTAGSVIPRQIPDVTTTLSRKNDFFLDIGLNETMQAHGKLYWDDGDSIDSKFNLIEWSVSNGTFFNNIKTYDYKTQMRLNTINIFSLPAQVHTVTINGDKIPFKHNTQTKVLSIEEINIDLGKVFQINWL